MFDRILAVFEAIFRTLGELILIALFLIVLMVEAMFCFDLLRRPWPEDE
jgi:dolichyl-phosphate-mannose--protein O-mannosyl transferase